MKLAFFNFFTFFALACIQAQLIPFLNELGVTPFQKSFVLGISALIALILSFIIGKISDSIGKIKPSFLLCLIFYNFFFAGAVFISNFWIQIIFLAFMFACLKQVMACAETIVFQLKKEAFGKYHAMSSIGLVCGSLISGSIFQNYGAPILVFLCLIFSSLSLGMSFFIQEQKKKKKPVSFSQIKKLFKNKDYLLLLLIFFFLMMIGFADQFIVTDKLLSLKASKTIISVKFAIQALMELPIYFFSEKLFKRFDSFFILLFTCLMSGIKFFLYGFVQKIVLILMVSMLQVVTHPLLVIVSKKMIQEITPSSLQASSQLVGFAVYFSLAGFITPLLGQGLVTIYGYSMALYFFAALAIIPFFMSMIMKKKKSCGKVGTGD